MVEQPVTNLELLQAANGGSLNHLRAGTKRRRESLQMKCQVLQEVLHKALISVAWALPSKALIASADAIRVEATGGRLHLSVTDYTSWAEIFCPVRIEQDGMALLSGRRFLETIANLGEERLLLQSQSKGSGVEVRSEHGRATLAGMNPEDFPVRQSSQEPLIRLTLATQDFLEGIKAVSFCSLATGDGGMPMLHGVNIRFGETETMFEACDSSRASLYTISCSNKGMPPVQIVIPAGPIELAVKYVEQGPGSELHLSMFPARLEVQSDQYSFTIQALSGKYPDLQKLLPESPATFAFLAGDELAGALRFVRVYTDQEVVILQFTEHSVRVYAQLSDVGEAEITVDAEVQGPPIKVALNARYVLQWLDLCRGQKIEIALTKKDRPVRFRVKDTPAGRCYLCMPVYLQGLES